MIYLFLYQLNRVFFTLYSLVTDIQSSSGFFGLPEILVENKNDKKVEKIL